jgi:allantoin racemase
MSTLELGQNPAAAPTAIVEQARQAVETDRAEVICLGCGGMAGLGKAITEALRVPVVDPVAAGVRLAEAVAGLGLSASRIRTYTSPEPKTIIGWPLPKHLSL